MRTDDIILTVLPLLKFLSIQAQDFIEESDAGDVETRIDEFLSIQAQDFIEETQRRNQVGTGPSFLSIQAQDFIEEVIRMARISPASNS